MNEATPAPTAAPVSPDPHRPFADPRMAALACGLVAMVLFAVPRLRMSMTFGGQRYPFPWEIADLAWASLWGGALALVPAVVRRERTLAIELFLLGWSCAYLGTTLSDPQKILDGIQAAVFALGLSPSGHAMFWLDRIARFTDVPLALGMIVLVWSAAWRARPARVVLALLAAEAVFPVLWLLSAVAQSVLSPRSSVIHTINFFLLLLHFALWAVCPWLFLARGPSPRE